MKQFCLNCDKVFYPTRNNGLGYPYYWGGYWANEQQRYVHDTPVITIENKVFHSRSCQDEYLAKHINYLTPIFKQLKEREGNNARTREDQTELAQATGS